MLFRSRQTKYNSTGPKTRSKCEGEVSESVSDEQDRPGEIYDLIEEKIAQHPGMPYMVAHDEVRHENTELWERAGRELALRRVAGEKQEATRESESDEPAPGREVISGDSARKNKRSVKK